MGMKASAKFKWGSDNLNGKRVVVQGIGHVGENLVKHLTEKEQQLSSMISMKLVCKKFLKCTVQKS